MRADEARLMFDTFLDKLRSAFPRPDGVQSKSAIFSSFFIEFMIFLSHFYLLFTYLIFVAGKFQNYMAVSIVNDGPVTLEIESPYCLKAVENPGIALSSSQVHV